MLAAPLAFPSHIPEGYEGLPDEPVFDAGRHLQIEAPDRIWTLEEFGYSDEEIDNCASAVAVTSPFRLLSDDGIAEFHRVATDLKRFHTSSVSGSRVPSHLAGGVYRSRFLRDFCSCAEVIEHISGISGTPLAPHSMPSQQAYINYAPDDITKAVDSWHYDGIGFDFVLMLSDPSRLKGGNFEYFQGTKAEVAKLFNLEVPRIRDGIREELPPERVVRMSFPAAGHAIFQQGNMVVHRAARLLEPADRITLVPGFVSLDISRPDPTARHDILNYDEPGVETELARHSAWLAQNRLRTFIDNAGLQDSPENLAATLEETIAELTATSNYLKSKKHNTL